MNLVQLETCPDWPLVGVISKGNWTNSIAEFFAESENSAPSHIHFYCTKEHARSLWSGFAPNIQAKIKACKTVSFKMTKEEAERAIQIGLGPEPWLVSNAVFEEAVVLGEAVDFEFAWKKRRELLMQHKEQGTWPKNVFFPFSS
jgi:hypothetical protein